MEIRKVPFDAQANRFQSLVQQRCPHQRRLFVLFLLDASFPKNQTHTRFFAQT